MEEIGATNPKFTSHCKFNGANLCAHAQKTIPWHPFTRLLNKYLHCIHVLESLTQSLLRSFSLILRMRLIKLLPVINNILHTCYFVLVSFIFTTHLFRGLAGACVISGIIFQISFCALTCLSNNSLIS